MGNHRAVIRVDQPGNAVVVDIPWRRRDKDADQKSIIVMDAATGERVTNVARVSITRERGVFIFEPKKAGDYFVYYMPFKFFPY